MVNVDNRSYDNDDCNIVLWGANNTSATKDMLTDIKHKCMISH
jgi:hypothetical protein